MSGFQLFGGGFLLFDDRLQIFPRGGEFLLHFLYALSPCGGVGGQSDCAFLLLGNRNVSLFFDDDQELFGGGMIGLHRNHGQVQGTDVFSGRNRYGALERTVFVVDFAHQALHFHGQGARRHSGEIERGLSRGMFEIRSRVAAEFDDPQRGIHHQSGGRVARQQHLVHLMMGAHQNVGRRRFVAALVRAQILVGSQVAVPICGLAGLLE